MRQACMCVGECLRAHVRLGASAGTGQKLRSKKWRASWAQIEILTTLHRRNKTSAISKQVSEFTSDTIETTNRKSALATKIFIFSHFFQFFKTLERTFSSSVDSQNSFKRKKVSNRKRKTCSSCIWHPTKGCFKNSKTKIKTKKQRRSGRASGRTCTSLSHNDGKRSHGVYSPNHLVNHKCISVCVILSLCLSYPVLRLLVSPRLQQELHSCGATFFRGPNERCDVVLNKDRGRERGRPY